MGFVRGAGGDCYRGLHRGGVKEKGEPGKPSRGLIKNRLKQKSETVKGVRGGEEMLPQALSNKHR